MIELPSNWSVRDVAFPILLALGLFVGGVAGGSLFLFATWYKKNLPYLYPHGCIEVFWTTKDGENVYSRIQYPEYANAIEMMPSMLGALQQQGGSVISVRRFRCQ